MYELARDEYAKQGIDTERAIEALSKKAISMHCWQGDDVMGFDQKDNAASGGIMTTGNYPGRAQTPEQLMADFEKAASMIPGKKRINLHASYAIFNDENPWVDRDKLEYKHFAPWVAWAKEKGFGIDFNPTLFSHPMVKEGLTVSSPEKEVREFWIAHCIACRKIAQQIGEELNDNVLNNFWIPDGLKDYPSDRFGVRKRLKESLDEIYSFETPNVIDSVEQKLFGIGVEGFTAGNQEFYVSYAAKKGGNHVVLIDAGHFNPTENIADKLPSLLQFFPYVPLHVTRSMHWDSDHVVLFEDQIKEIASEVVRCPDGMDKILIGMDFFDASINRIGAWVTGMRAMEKCLLYALLQPWDKLKSLQDSYQFSEKMILGEQFSSMPWGAVWDEYCARQGVCLEAEIWNNVKAYEDEVLSKRQDGWLVGRRGFASWANMWLPDSAKKYLNSLVAQWLGGLPNGRLSDARAQTTNQPTKR